MTHGQGIQKAILIIESQKGFAKLSKNSEKALAQLDEIIEHLKFVGQFYM
jgi:hypothetical protein